MASFGPPILEALFELLPRIGRETPIMPTNQTRCFHSGDWYSDLKLVNTGFALCQSHANAFTLHHGTFMKPARILISDDFPMVRRGLRIILEASQRFEVCGEAGDENQTMELAEKLAPDILTLDISMPPPNGLEVAAQIRQTDPDMKILIITMHDAEEILHAAAVAGASGYLLKSEAEELLLTALSLLEGGQYFVSPAFSPEARQLFERKAV